jgi:phage terminase large subunit GpA-like protein
LRPRPRPGIVTWAERNLYLPKKESPRLSGLMNFGYSSWMRGPCEWFADAFVREITLVGPLQFGKTLYATVCLAYSIRFDPMPTMLVMASKSTLNKRMKRLRALFEANDFLMAELRGRLDNLNVGEPSELVNLLLVLAWASSDAVMAESPEGVIIADEVALWPATVPHSDMKPTDHLRGRQETFEQVRKFIKISSPRETADLADEEFEAGDACEMWCPCHACSYWHILRWYDKEQPGCHAVLDKTEKGEWLSLREYASADRVHYVCPSCGKIWTDYERAANVDQGIWLPRGVTMGRAGRIEGTIVPSAFKSARIRGLLVHPRLRSIRKMACDWVRGQMLLKTGQTSGLKHFLNNQEAQPWKDVTAVTDESKLREHIGIHHSGQNAPSDRLPWGVQALTIAVDVHDNWFRVAVHGWGFLFESWLIDTLSMETSDTKELEAFAPLKPLLVRPWQLADGMWLRPSAIGIDCGFRPESVTNFCRENRVLVHNGNLVPVRGSPRQMTKMYAKFAQDQSLIVYELNALMLKDQLWRMLFETEQPGGGYMHLPADITPEIIGELCSEHKIMVKRRLVWLPKKEGRANHAWDASYYNLFLAHLVGVGTLGALPEAPPPPAPLRPKPKREEGRQAFLDGLPDLSR